MQYLESPSLHSNLVKSFLTSITFDSLSRKIKNLCLVINFNFYTKEEIIMHNFKKNFSYVIVAALVAALSISCKSNENPDSGARYLEKIRLLEHILALFLKEIKQQFLQMEQ